MIMKKVVFMLVLVTSLLLIPAAFGHHGYAMFDTKAVVTLQATVTDFHWLNPHCIVEFEAKDEKGQVLDWQGELTSPSHLATRGWSATTIEAGAQLTITGYRAKNGTPSIWVTKIVLANGKPLVIVGEN